MNIRKLATVTAAIAMAATVSAGASYSGTTHKTYCSFHTAHHSSLSSEQLQWIKEICKEYGLDCDWNSGGNKPETQPETKPETQPETKPETQPETKPETQPETKPETQPETKPETQPETKPETQPETKPETQPETKPETQPETKPETQPETKPEQTPDNVTSQSSFASQVVSLVNSERAKAGLAPVTIDSKVQNAALVRAKEQAQSFSHTRPNGSSCFTALTEAGVNYRGAGENIAYGQRTPQEVMNAWMNSSGHRANILNKNFTSIGVGYTVINGTPYWAQMFTY